MYAGDTVTIGELCSTLGKLAVRNEFCQEIVDLGGLKMVLQILTENIKSQVSDSVLHVSELLLFAPIFCGIYFFANS